VSLILDALNRSRREEESVPGLATQHYAEPSQPGWRRTLPWAGLCLAVAVIAWLLLRDAPGVAPATPPEPAAPTAARVGPAPQEPAPAGLPAPVPVAPTAALEERAKAAVPPAARPSPPPAARAGAPRPAPEPRASVPPAAADPEVTALYRQAQNEAAPAAAAASGPAAGRTAQTVPPEAPAAGEEPVDIAKLVEAAQSELKNLELVEHAAPFLVELSQHTKDQIPTIFYQRHDYAGDPARSTVVLNGKQLRVGGTAAPGVKVVEILPDSVVLSHDGREFRLRALNSWVNL